jgi:hypothetical protein
MARKNSILPLTERLFAKLDMSGGPDACWEWQGSRDKGGYGKIGNDHRILGTHRVAYEIANGPIPDGLFVLHTCDNPPCCNPRHLFLGTHLVNMLDMLTKGRKRGGLRPGEQNKNAKLTEAQAMFILCSGRRRSIPRKKMSEMFGVSLRVIAGIITGTKWKHLQVQCD